MKILYNLYIAIFIISFVFITNCIKQDENKQHLPQKKVLYIDSYHAEYPWSAGITKAILNTFELEMDDSGKIIKNDSNIDLKIIRMDTKKNNSTEYINKKAIEVKQFIDSWKPDVVIASDDNASKYIIVPYYKNKKTPFVFCGVNWDVTAYGYPFKNVTGMIEVDLLPQLLSTMKSYAKGSKIGYLSSDNFSNRKVINFYKKIFNITFDSGAFVKTTNDWKSKFISLQKKVDMLIIVPPSGIEDWNRDEMSKFVENNIIIPVGCTEEWVTPYTLIGFSKISTEQGEWSAQTALEILNNKSPENIPIIKNKKAKIILNMRFAKKLGIKFPVELIEKSSFVE